LQAVVLPRRRRGNIADGCGFDAPQQALLHGRRSLDRGQRLAQLRELGLGGGEAFEHVPIAARQPGLDLVALVALERAAGVQEDQLVSLVGAHGVPVPYASARSVLRSASSPCRIRVFTVPSGSPSCSAISRCESPSKKFSSTARRWDSGSSSSARSILARRWSASASSNGSVPGPAA